MGFEKTSVPEDETLTTLKDLKPKLDTLNGILSRQTFIACDPGGRFLYALGIFPVQSRFPGLVPREITFETAVGDS